MGSGSSGEPAPVRGSSRRSAPLELDASLRFPMVRSMPFPHPVTESVTKLLNASLCEGGFLVRAIPPSSSPRARDPRPALQGLFQLAERDIERGPTSGATLEFFLALLIAGIALGTFETLLAGSVVFGFPWAVGALLIGLAFWYRYGRSFESEVIVAAIRLPSGERPGDPATGGTPRPPVVVWQAGRLRSELHGGRRIATRVLDCPVPLARNMVLAAQRFHGAVGDPMAPDLALGPA